MRGKRRTALSTSRIAWTGITWNPTLGCTRAGPGRECTGCYAERGALRILRMSAARGIESPYADVVHEVDGEARWTGTIRRASDTAFGKMRKFLRHAERAARGETQRMRVFVNSMSDLFHPDAVASGLTRAVFDELLENPGHDYQILTKRPEVAADYYASDPRLHHHPDIWLGVSVGIAAAKGRIDVLRAIPAARRFLSLEPLLEALGSLDLSGIDWVIAGGESGPDARRCDPDWLREIHVQCAAAGATFFLKQLGGFPDPHAHEKAILDGRTWTEFPPPLARPPCLLPLHDPTPGECRSEEHRKRASLPVPIDPAFPQGSDDRLDDPTAPHAERLLALHDKLRRREERSLPDIIALGREWLAARPAIAASSMDEKAWCLKHMPFGVKWAGNCATIFRRSNVIREAFHWFQMEGEEAGYRLDRQSGVEFWIGLLRVWDARQEPPKPTKKQREKARRAEAAALEERLEAAEERAARAEADRDTYLAELERVVHLHQKTDEGFGFRSDVLEAARRQRAEAERVPPFETWRASRSGGGRGAAREGRER